VTGTRAEYGLLKDLMKEIKKSESFSLQIIVTGMHLSPLFGSTIQEIKKDGFKISSKIKMTPQKDTLGMMARSIGEGIIGITSSLERLKPDIVIILGDRVEALSAAISAAYMNIAIAHIHGGDVSRAGLDEYARHAITKISHIHFPATKKSGQRIIKMGEDKKRVFVVGAPGIDSILNEKIIAPKKIAEKYNIDLAKPIILMLQHPVTTETKESFFQAKETMEAVQEIGYQAIIIYPNADAGGRAMINVIKKYKKYPFIKIYKNIPRLDFLSLMKNCSVMIGNSSAGIIESPSFCIPVVNIGLRQEGRERAKNIIDVNHNKNEIKKAIKKAIFEQKFRTNIKKCRNPYGNGMASKKIVDILSKIKIDKKLLQKKLTY